MWAAVNIDHIAHLQHKPDEWDALKVKGSYMFWFILNLEDTSLDASVPVIKMTEYEAMGWKFYSALNQGYLKFYEDSNLFEQLPNKDAIVKHPKKRRDGVVVEWPMRYKYVLSDEDKLQGIAFWKVMEPHVQRAIESQTG